MTTPGDPRPGHRHAGGARWPAQPRRPRLPRAWSRDRGSPPPTARSESSPLADRPLTDPALGMIPDRRTPRSSPAANAGLVAGRRRSRSPKIFGNHVEQPACSRPGLSVQRAFLDPYLWKLRGGRQAVGAEGPASQRRRRQRRPRQAVPSSTNWAFIGVRYKTRDHPSRSSVIRIAKVPTRSGSDASRAAKAHSWEDLDDLLLATVALTRQHHSDGGGIGTAGIGRWAQAYGARRHPGLCGDG